MAEYYSTKNKVKLGINFTEDKSNFELEDHCIYYHLYKRTELREVTLNNSFHTTILTCLNEYFIMHYLT